MPHAGVWCWGLCRDLASQLAKAPQRRSWAIEVTEFLLDPGVGFGEAAGGPRDGIDYFVGLRRPAFRCREPVAVELLGSETSGEAAQLSASTSPAATSTAAVTPWFFAKPTGHQRRGLSHLFGQSAPRPSGRTPENIIHQYLHSVRPSHERFMEPSKRHDDVIFPPSGLNAPALGGCGTSADTPQVEDPGTTAAQSTLLPAPGGDSTWAAYDEPFYVWFGPDNGYLAVRAAARVDSETENALCEDAVAADKASGSLPGATFYLGGTSSIYIDKGKLEILRRRQGNTLVSIHALTNTTGTYKASSLGWNDDLLSTKSGSPNQDIVLHGLAWAPRAQLSFGNVTNVANGQLLGGAAFARIDLRAAASASNFIIRVETSDIP